MRILILGSFLSRRFAGSAHATMSIANALAASSWAKVSVFGYECDLTSLDPRLDVIEASAPPELRFVWRFPSMFAVGQTARVMARRALPEVDVCYTRSTVLALAYRRLFPRTLIVSHTGFVLPGREHVEETGRPALEARFESMLVDRLELRAYAEPAWTHVVSTSLVAREREKYYGLPRGFFSVCPLPVDAANYDRDIPYEPVRSSTGIPRDAFLIVTVARLVPLKNIDFLLRAVAGSSTTPWLAVVGDGPEESALRALSVELGISERVRFVGRTLPAPWLAEADLFALPSRLESFGLAYAEAMSMGVPCLGLGNRPPATLTAAEEVIPEGEVGYCVTSVEEMSSRIDQLASDPELRRTMAAAAYRRARALYTTEHYLAHLRSTISGVRLPIATAAELRCAES